MTQGFRVRMVHSPVTTASLRPVLAWAAAIFILVTRQTPAGLSDTMSASYSTKLPLSIVSSSRSWQEMRAW